MTSAMLSECVYNSRRGQNGESQWPQGPHFMIIVPNRQFFFSLSSSTNGNPHAICIRSMLRGVFGNGVGVMARLDLFAGIGGMDCALGE